MLIKLAWRHLWAAKDLLLILLLALSLVAGFAVMLPIYQARLADQAARIVADDLTAEMTTITLSQSTPIDPEAQAVIAAALGDVTAGPMPYSRAPGMPEYPGLGKICGYRYVQGDMLTVNTPLAVSTADHCYVPYSFDDLETIFTLVDGRWPQDIPDAEEPSTASPHVMDAPQVEAVLGMEAADLAHIRIGDRMVIGQQPDRAVVVEIVGLTEPREPEESVFWHGHMMTLRGEWTAIGDDMRLELAPVVTETAFDHWIAPLTETPYYAWWLNVNSDALSAANLATLDADLYEMERQLRFMQPEINVLTGLRAAADQYRAQVAQFEDVVIVMGAALGAILLAMLSALALLLLDQQRATWFILFSRGANRRQTVSVMLLALAGLGVLSIGLGLVWACVLVDLIGPAALPGDSMLDTLTWETPLDGAGAIALAMIALALPAWIIVRRSQKPPRPAMRYPLPKAIWARIYLDVILLVAGAAAVFRLYYLASDGLAQSLRDLASDPGLFAERIAAGQVGLAANGLGDPFNIVGPVLIVIGLLLIGLRVYSWLARIPTWIMTRWGGVAGLIAWRQVTRAPGHATVLVLMMAGSLVLGAGSVMLDATHDAAAWDTARHATGADVSIVFDLREASASQQGWTDIPGVAESISLLKLDSIQPSMTLFGVEPDALPATAAIPAFAAPIDTLPGIVLPDKTIALEAAVYSVPNPEDPGAMALSMVLLDRRGVPVTLPMDMTTRTDGEFVIYRGALPEDHALRPFRLTGFRLASERSTRHTIYLDQIVAVDGQDPPTLVEDFEAETLTGWVSAPDQPESALWPKRTMDYAADGVASLSLDYDTRFTHYTNLQPLLLTTPPDHVRLPAIVSQAFIDGLSQRTKNEPRLGIGDKSGIRLELPFGGFWLPYEIVGIVPDLPTMTERDRFIVVPFGALRLTLNASVMGDTNYDTNQAWLKLENGADTAQLRSVLHNMPGIVETTFATDRYNVFKHDPALLAVIGLLRFGFGTGAGLSILYLLAHKGITVPRFRESLVLLWTLGGRHVQQHIERVIALEFALWTLLALVMSTALGALLVYLLLLFMPLLGPDALHVSLGTLSGVWIGTIIVGVVIIGIGIQNFRSPLTTHPITKPVFRREKHKQP